MIFTSTRRKVGITMLFAIVVALYFSVLFSIAAILEFCLFRLDDFRRTQRKNYPEICSVIDKVWAVLHLSFIFDQDDEPITEYHTEPAFHSSFTATQEKYVSVSDQYDRVA